MADLGFVALIIAFFLVAAAFVRGCELIIGRAEDADHLVHPVPSEPGGEEAA